MPDADETLVDSIKELEISAAEDRSPDKFRDLLGMLVKLQGVKDGPLEYIDSSTVEEIKRLYKTDTEKYWRRLDERDTSLVGGNPNHYAWLAAGIELVVIEKTQKNEELAELIVKQIILAINRILKNKRG